MDGPLDLVSLSVPLFGFYLGIFWQNLMKQGRSIYFSIKLTPTEEASAKRWTIFITVIPIVLEMKIITRFKQLQFLLYDRKICTFQLMLCCRSQLPALYPLFFNNLQDNIPSVRQGAAVALCNVVKAYGKDRIFYIFIATVLYHSFSLSVYLSVCLSLSLSLSLDFVIVIVSGSMLSLTSVIVLLLLCFAVV